MYNLGDYFKINYEDGIANPKCVYSGAKYRISVLSERLLRLEYNPHGTFEDRPTELVLNRKFEDLPKFVVKEDPAYIQIKTTYFTLFYTKEAPFQGSKFNPTANLKVTLNDDKKIWYYGHPEVRNFGSPSDLLLGNKNAKLQKGLYSLDGFVSIDDTKTSIFLENGETEKRNYEGVDIYLFMYGKDFNLCLKDYFELTGKPGLIPRYALGNWWSKNEDYSEEDVIKLVNSFDLNEIPLSIILLDEGWHKRLQVENNYLHTGFSFESKLYKDPIGLIKFLHSKGIRLGVNINPIEGLTPIDDFYEKAKSYLKTDEKGNIPVNVYDPKFIDVYLKLYIHPLDTIGIDFYWLNYYDKKLKQELFLLKHYSFQDMTRDYKRRPMILSYNSGLASHRYPVLYSGKTVVSWETLKNIPIHNASSANIGVSFWSHDIGGYHEGIEDNELYIRFVQLGVFSPILKFGSDKGKYYKREPWRWNIKTYMIVKRYLQMRHQLIPYIYSESYKYTTQGVPLVQPIYYKFPETYDDPLYKNEYYFGGELFVSPILKSKDYVMNRTIHKFFMPDGVWYDITTGKRFNGGRSYVSFFRDEDYPVFARSGAIIPFSNNKIINDTTPPKDLEINVYPGRSNTYKLYEDDGLSDLYKKGFYLLTDINYNYNPDNYNVVIKAVEGKSGIIPATRNYKIVFKNTRKPDSMSAHYNNDEIAFASYQTENDFIIELKDVNTIGQVTVDIKGEKLEMPAVRLINEDIGNILGDLQIQTVLKVKIDEILFSDDSIQKKRIKIRKLKKVGLEQKYIVLFIKLLEYIENI